MLSPWFCQLVPISPTRETQTQSYLQITFFSRGSVKFAQKHCPVCVYNTEHVGGYRGLIHVHHNEKQKLCFAHEQSLGSLLGA